MATRDASGEPTGRPAWTNLADALLQRSALVARVARDRAPDPFAGLKVDDADLAALLSELPGLASGDEEADLVAEASAPAARAAIEQFLGHANDGDALCEVAEAAHLGDLELLVLAVLCAVELDPRRQRLVGYLHDDVTLRRPTLFLLEVLFADLLGPSTQQLVATVGPAGGLRRAALISVADDAPWSAATISVAPSLLWWLKGVRQLDPGLPPGAVLADAPITPGTARLAVASGPDRVRRIQAATAALDAAGYLISPLPADPSSWDALVRQASLVPLGIVLEVDDDLPPEARARIERADHLTWGITSHHDLPLASLPRGEVVDATVAPPVATDDEWVAATGSGNDGVHPLTAEQLQLLSPLLRGGASRDHAIRRLAGGRLDRLATRIRPTRTFHDLVVDDLRRTLLDEVVARYRHRQVVFEEWGFRADPSTGVIALFSGPSGTGKTLAAEIIAGELGLDLYKIDISALVSKYIGETEKNLARVFEVAEVSNVALFFDEADAILGKRSEVSDAHDRYANVEVAYLLQRLEVYDGLVFLATNLPKNIDAAFTRRIHVAVEFPMPELPERRLIWERSLPEGAPVRDLDLDQLAAATELSGGGIRNAALTAAFLAAESGVPIDMDIAIAAVEREYHKLGRLFDGG